MIEQLEKVDIAAAIVPERTDADSDGKNSVCCRIDRSSEESLKAALAEQRL